MSYRLGRTLRELENTLTVEELVLYAAEEAIEPRGEIRADLRAGTIAAAVSNPWRGSRRPFKPADFMPKFGASEKPKDLGLIKAEAMAWVIGVGGQVHPPRGAIHG